MVGDLDFAAPLQGLAPQEEAFAMAIHQGNSYSDAYRISYKPQFCANNTISRIANTIKKRPRVAARIKQLRLLQESKSVLSGNFLFNHTISKLYEISCQDGHKDQMKALIALGKSEPVGLFNKKEKDITTIKDSDVEQRLLKLIDKVRAREMIDITPNATVKSTRRKR